MPEFDRAAYWEHRYAVGGTSGPGSQGAEALYKAGHVNHAVREYGITSLLDLGCGDGTIAAMLAVPIYVGYDPSSTALVKAHRNAPGCVFVNNLSGLQYQVDATLSMDVLFHLVRDDDYRAYLAMLFARAKHFVLIYGTNAEQGGTAPHVRHRAWRPDVPADFHMIYHLVAARPEFKDFWIFERDTGATT